MRPGFSWGRYYLVLAKSLLLFFVHFDALLRHFEIHRLTQISEQPLKEGIFSTF